MLFEWSQMAAISQGGQSGTAGRTGVEGRLWEEPRMTHTSCWNLCYHPSASGGEKPVTLHRQIPCSQSKCERASERASARVQLRALRGQVPFAARLNFWVICVKWPQDVAALVTSAGLLRQRAGVAAAAVTQSGRDS